MNNLSRIWTRAHRQKRLVLHSCDGLGSQLFCRTPERPWCQYIGHSRLHRKMRRFWIVELPCRLHFLVAGSKHNTQLLAGRSSQKHSTDNSAKMGDLGNRHSSEMPLEMELAWYKMNREILVVPLQMRIKHQIDDAADHQHILRFSRTCSCLCRHVRTYISSPLNSTAGPNFLDFRISPSSS